MKRVWLVLVALSLLFVSSAMAETVTFQWTQPDLTYVKHWQIHWSDTENGTYESIAVVAYNGTPSATYSSEETIVLTGPPATSITKWFLARACGDVPVEGGSTEYKCSGDSNKISKAFWIPAGQFSVPLNFEIIPNP